MRTEAGSEEPEENTDKVRKTGTKPERNQKENRKKTERKQGNFYAGMNDFIPVFCINRRV